ncbi:MAG TPA: thioredoxin family protein [Bacteroidia bacterium]|jgi:thiol:disulfide interchange protein DsbD
MISRRKNLLAALFLFVFALPVWGQIQHPVKWTFSVTRTCDEEALLFLKAKIEPGWHLYSQKVVEDGPIPTSFQFDKSPDYSLSGKTQEGKAITKIEPAFDNKELAFFEEHAQFIQKIKISSGGAFSIKGTLNFMVCNDQMCLPPEDVKFEFRLDAASGKKCETKDPQTTNTPCDCDSAAIYKILAKNDSLKKNNETKKDTAKQNVTEIKPSDGNKKDSGGGDCNIWLNFLEGLAAGFGALIAPCIYAMLPLTVSFFMKQSKTRAQGIRRASLYGIFIVLIFDLFGLLVVIALGRDAPNLIASSVYLNLFLFILFFIFAASFLGAFEITLPSSWVNKVDAASDKGGIAGIFFMALTLTLVSFSCTVPFIGGLLSLVSYGNYLCPLAGFTGFGLAIALPFALCAALPSLLTSMPKSGGWLNAVKVTLGLLELALAMKFFSNADINGHWHILSRELFIALWIAIFGVLGLYLLGKIKFHHDSDVSYLSVTRATLAVCAIAFAIYLLPGLWGAPLNLVGAFPPPSTEEWSENFNSFGPGSGGGNGNNNGTGNDPNNTSENHHSKGCPKGIDNCFHDYYEALAYAKKTGKPLMVDFTGWTCVNCRKMEQNVWPKSGVRELINNDYVLVSLYVDERNPLPVDSQYYSKVLDKKIISLGDKWTDIESSRYNNNAQPYYVLLDHDQKLLQDPRGYTPDVEEYSKFLKQGLEEFKKRKK